jgi:hypothetical protein
MKLLQSNFIINKLVKCHNLTVESINYIKLTFKNILQL